MTSPETSLCNISTANESERSGAYKPCIYHHPLPWFVSGIISHKLDHCLFFQLASYWGQELYLCMHLDSTPFSRDLISAWGIAIILITVTESLRCALAGVEPKEKASLWTIRKAEAYSALTMEFLTFAKLGIAICIIFQIPCRKP